MHPTMFDTPVIRPLLRAISVITLRLDVPILMGFLDFERKRGGFLGTFTTTGNTEADIALIRSHYAGIRGKKSSQFSQ